MEKNIKNTNLNSNVKEDTRETFALMFTLYNLSENYKVLYKKDPNGFERSLISRWTWFGIRHQA